PRTWQRHSFAPSRRHLPHRQGKGDRTGGERSCLASQIVDLGQAGRLDAPVAGGTDVRKTCLDQVYELAKLDNRVVFIGSDLGPDTLVEMREEMPDRFFMEGVSEANVIGMAAGLAMEGYIPYVNTI